MNKNYFDLTSTEQRDLLRFAENKFGLSDTIIEKENVALKRANLKELPIV